VDGKGDVAGFYYLNILGHAGHPIQVSFVHVCVCVYVYVCMPVCVCVYMYVHAIHAHLHTHAHTCTHTFSVSHFTHSLSPHTMTHPQVILRSSDGYKRDWKEIGQLWTDKIHLAGYSGRDASAVDHLQVQDLTTGSTPPPKKNQTESKKGENVVTCLKCGDMCVHTCVCLYDMCVYTCVCLYDMGVHTCVCLDWLKCGGIQVRLPSSSFRVRRARCHGRHTTISPLNPRAT
jgi:hypothetical protein